MYVNDVALSQQLARVAAIFVTPSPSNPDLAAGGRESQVSGYGLKAVRDDSIGARHKVAARESLCHMPTLAPCTAPP